MISIRGSVSEENDGIKEYKNNSVMVTLNL